MYLIYEPLFLQVLYMCEEDFLQEVHANLDFYNLVIYFPCSTYLQDKSTNEPLVFDNWFAAFMTIN